MAGGIRKALGALLAGVLMTGVFAMEGCSAASDNSSAGASSAEHAVTEKSSYEVVDAAYVRQNPEDAVVVDVRTAQEYDEGHIPGAVNLSYSTTPCLADELEQDMAASYAEAGLGPEVPLILYCRSGVRAQAAACVLERIGYQNVCIYEASWLDWTADPENPIETDY